MSEVLASMQQNRQGANRVYAATDDRWTSTAQYERARHDVSEYAVHFLRLYVVLAVRARCQCGFPGANRWESLCLLPSEVRGLEALQRPGMRLLLSMCIFLNSFVYCTILADQYAPLLSVFSMKERDTRILSTLLPGSGSDG